MKYSCGSEYGDIPLGTILQIIGIIARNKQTPTTMSAKIFRDVLVCSWNVSMRSLRIA